MPNVLLYGKENGMTDEKRLQRAIGSDRQDEPKATFHFLYAKYKPLVFFVVARYLKDREEIEDVVQETFVRFFSHAEDVRSSVKSYLTASAKNLALTVLKRREKVIYTDESDLSADDFVREDFANNEFEALISDMKRVLSAQDIQIILLHLLEDLRFEDIAEKLHANTRTIKTRYYRALKRYRKERGDAE